MASFVHGLMKLKNQKSNPLHLTKYLTKNLKKENNMNDNLTPAQIAFYEQLKKNGGRANCRTTVCKGCGTIMGGTK